MKNFSFFPPKWNFRLETRIFRMGRRFLHVRDGRQGNPISTHGLVFGALWESQALVICASSLFSSCFFSLLRLAGCSSPDLSLAHSWCLCSHTTPCLYLLFVMSVMRSLQAYTGWVRQQGTHAWEEEEQLTYVHFITWPQITSLNHLNTLSKSFIWHLCVLSSNSYCTLPAKVSQRY